MRDSSLELRPSSALKIALGRFAIISTTPSVFVSDFNAFVLQECVCVVSARCRYRRVCYV